MLGRQRLPPTGSRRRLRRPPDSCTGRRLAGRRRWRVGRTQAHVRGDDHRSGVLLGRRRDGPARRSQFDTRQPRATRRGPRKRHRRRDDRAGSFVRGHQNRRGEVLGGEPLRATRGRHVDQPPGAGRRQGVAGGRRERLRRPLPHLRAHDVWWGAVLGRQHVRPAGRRHDGGAVHPHPRVRAPARSPRAAGPCAGAATGAARPVRAMR